GSTFDYEILDEETGNISHRPWGNILLEIENIEVENGITKIGDISFAYISKEEPNLSTIKTVEMPSTLKEIGLYAFSASSIENLVIPDGVTSIGSGAFAGCGILEEITIPATINTIGYDVFDESYKVELVKYLGTEEEWVNIDWGFDVTDYNVYFQNENKYLLINCFHKDGKIIAEYLTEYGKEQEKIVVPDYVNQIYESTFKLNDEGESAIPKAKEIFIPNSVEMIQDNTFSMFDKTTTIKIDVSKERYHEIFKGDVSNTNVILEDGKPPKFNISMQNGDITFVGLNEKDETMTSITIPNYVKKIAKDAFVNAPNLTEIHIDKTEEEFHQMYPYVMDSKYTLCLKDNESVKFKINYNNGAYWLMDLTDAGSSLEGELVIPNYINYIADGLDNIKATSIVFSENVTNIKIKNCTNLQSITINNTNIDSFIICARDISGCGKLKEIKYAGKISDWKSIYYDSYLTSGQEIIVHCSDGDITSYI
ncbi:MAG: leucine-rich repeat domain-containing protein, partial [Spirochaetales bacterium]|nr:leucine-rich repeat domain-containing protein [Spirochaetales bacterium]